MWLLEGNKCIPNGQFHLEGGKKKKKKGLQRINEAKGLCLQLDVKCKHRKL